MTSNPSSVAWNSILLAVDDMRHPCHENLVLLFCLSSVVLDYLTSVLGSSDSTF